MLSQNKKIAAEIKEIEQAYQQLKTALDQACRQGHSLVRQMNDQLAKAQIEQTLDKIKNKYN